VNLLLVSVGIRDAGHCVHTWAVPGLTTAGHHVVPFDPYIATELYGWTGGQRLLLQTVKARRIDRILCFPPYDMIEPATGAACRDLGVPIIGFRYDDGILTAGHSGPRLAHLLSESQSTCHLTATTCEAAMAEAERLGLGGWELWPLPISPEPFPEGDGDKRYDVTFVGPAMLNAGVESGEHRSPPGSARHGPGHPTKPALSGIARELPRQPLADDEVPQPGSRRLRQCRPAGAAP
jgi:hypothetical protein